MGFLDQEFPDTGRDGEDECDLVVGVRWGWVKRV